MAFPSSSAVHDSSSGAAVGLQPTWSQMKQYVLADMRKPRYYKLVTNSDKYLGPIIFHYLYKYHFYNVDWFFEEYESVLLEARPVSSTRFFIDYGRNNYVKLCNSSGTPFIRHILQVLSFKMYECLVHLSNNHVIGLEDYMFFYDEYNFKELESRLNVFMPKLFKSGEVFSIALWYAKRNFKASNNYGGFAMPTQTVTRLEPLKIPEPVVLEPVRSPLSMPSLETMPLPIKVPSKTNYDTTVSLVPVANDPPEPNFKPVVANNVLKPKSRLINKYYGNGCRFDTTVTVSCPSTSNFSDFKVPKPPVPKLKNIEPKPPVPKLKIIKPKPSVSKCPVANTVKVPLVLLQRCDSIVKDSSATTSISDIASRRLDKYKRYFNAVQKSKFVEHIQTYIKMYNEYLACQDVEMRVRLVKLVYVSCRQYVNVIEYALKNGVNLCSNQCNH
ncbi:ORF7 [Leucania separata nucleopolyhedrovirus]|uniref:ORF7 n=1 Tax=Leucania separata nucleopolyhedrovirus TaxID=1307956 RepID=Q0ILB2_NPVLS|nr:ORF7 [Leucania separata nucleopolyhedrovirus]AAR28771.1 ORF7 [Leucania separata nucleopolyhedrovirus]